MSYRMSGLAARLACHFGGGGVTSTSADVPDFLKPLIGGSADRMLGLQNYFWGNAKNMGSGEDSGYTTPTGTGNEWGYRGLGPGDGSGGGGGDGGDGGGGDGGDGGGLPDPRRPGGRKIPGWVDTTKSKEPEDPDGEPIPEVAINPYTSGSGSGMNIQGKNVRGVAGASRLHEKAGHDAYNLGDVTRGEEKANFDYQNVRGMAGKRITGEEVMGDPAMMAAFNAFNTFDKPMIEDSATAAGFGRSLQKGQKMSMGLQQMMLPQIQASQGRAERGLDRDIQSYLSAGQGFQSLGAQETARKTGAINTQMGIADVQRKIKQEGYDADHDDFIRRASLGEGMLTGPFGGMVPSTIGSTVRSGGGK